MSPDDREPITGSCRWLRLYDREDNLVALPEEAAQQRADQEKQRAAQEAQRAEQEKQRADRRKNVPINRKNQQDFNR